MRGRLTPAAWAGYLVVLTASFVHAADASDRQVRTFRYVAERPIAVAVTIGQVEVTGEPREDVVVEVVRHAPAVHRLSALPVSIEDGPERIEIRAEQPHGGADPALRAEVTLRVPLSATIDAITLVEGRVHARDLAGRLTAAVKRGPVHASNVGGRVRLETGIGDVHVERARVGADGLLRLRTFNGDVRLHLAVRPSNARILALAMNGSIVSDIPLTMKESWGPRWGEARIGQGEPVISIDVVNGRIEVRSP